MLILCIKLLTCLKVDVKMQLLYLVDKDALLNKKLGTPHHV